MYRAEYKASNAGNAWSGIGSYGSESQALNAAERKKAQGAYMVRVKDKNGNVIFSA